MFVCFLFVCGCVLFFFWGGGGAGAGGMNIQQAGIAFILTIAAGIIYRVFCPWTQNRLILHFHLRHRYNI